ncbi:MAG: hypothetical protein ACI9PP_000751 [Halobacteriales archaeon]
MEPIIREPLAVFQAVKHSRSLPIQRGIPDRGGEFSVVQFERDRLDVGGEQLPVMAVWMYLGVGLDESGRFEAFETAIHRRSGARTQVDEFPGWSGVVTDGIQDRSDVRIVQQLENDLRKGRRFCIAISTTGSQ